MLLDRLPLTVTLAAALGAASAPVLAQAKASRPGPRELQKMADHMRFALAHRLGEPLVYVSRRAPKGQPDVMALLNDPYLRELFGMGDGPSIKPGHKETLEEREERQAREVVKVVQRILGRARTLEVSLVDLSARPDGEGRSATPYMVLRSLLAEDKAKIVGDFLKSGVFTIKSRTLSGHQVYVARSTGRAGGPIVECALVGCDFLASNHRQSMEQLLDPKTRATGPVLSKQPEYRQLRQRLAPTAMVPAGSMMIYANLRRLRKDLPGVLGGDARWLFRDSGLPRSDRMLLMASPHAKGIVASAVLSQPRPRAVGKAEGGKAKSRRRSFGWMNLLRPTRPRQLLDDMPGGGVASIAVGLNLEQLAQVNGDTQSWGLFQRFVYACSKLDLSPRRLLRKLDRRGAAQLILVRSKDGDGSARLAYSVEAKSRAAARELFEMVKSAAVAAGNGKADKAGGIETLCIDWPQWGGFKRGLPRRWRRSSWSRLYVAAVKDRVVLAFDRAVLLKAAQPGDSRSKSKRDRTIMRRLTALGAEQKKVGGIVVVNIGRIAEHFRGSASKNQPNDSTQVVPERGFFAPHAGYFNVEEGFVRMQVFMKL